MTDTCCSDMTYFQSLAARGLGFVQWILPEGRALPVDAWRPRHRVILWLVWLHALGILGFGLIVGAGPVHSVIEGSVVAMWALAANYAGFGQRTRSAAASFGLLTASALLVHLAGGAIEAHFHFFVMIAVIALYQDWVPFLLAIGFVVIEHGLVGVIMPDAVYDHADAFADPWKWAIIHAVFVLGASAAHVAHWRLSELTQAERRRTEVTQSQLAAIVTSSDDAIVSTSAGGNVTSWNNGAERLFGYSAAEMLGQPMAIVVPDARRSETSVLSDRLQLGERIASFETQSRRKDGTLVDISASLGSIHDASGNTVGTAIIAHDTTARRRAEAALAHQAHYDPLTDLPNRILLYQELQAALADSARSTSPVALLMLDLDRFKDVNDTFGHHYGDLLLKQVGTRLQLALGTDGMLARLGGDEFAALIVGMDGAQAVVIAERLLMSLAEPMVIESRSLPLEASIGIALCPEHGTDADTLLLRAEVAMYLAKSSLDGFATYDERRDQHSPDRLALAGQLRQAIEQDELVLHYQPKLDLASRTITGVEALARWPHPQLGLVPPDRFIPLAEQTALIQPLTEWVLNAALRQHDAWRTLGLELPVAVNFSMRNLLDPGIVDTVARLLSRWQVSPAALEVEITESSIMADPTRSSDVLRSLRALGVRIAIDDFGTGYSSLAHLKQLPVDVLKVDRSFVSDMLGDESDRIIVRSTIDLAHNLGLRVVAEGVEDEATADLLAQLGCDQAQGYHFSRPMPAPQQLPWLRAAGNSTPTSLAA
jgi:diguanylate cyclase (GGDEF)-like protein/PAS domain S-box-containing protein